MKKATMDVMTAASKLVGGLGGGEVAQRSRHDLEILALFDRCRSLLGAIRLLLHHDFVHEAVMLGRPLFTDSLMLAEYASVDEKRRVEMVVGWSLGSLADVEGIFHDARSRGDDVTEAMGNLAGQRAQLEEYARRYSARTRHWRPDDHAKTLASKHGLRACGEPAGEPCLGQVRVAQGTRRWGGRPRQPPRLRPARYGPGHATVGFDGEKSPLGPLCQTRT